MSFLTRLVSRGLVASGYADRCLRRRQESGPSFTILSYHRVGQAPAESADPRLFSATPAAFEWQMNYLQRHCVVLALEDLVDRARRGKDFPPNAVAVTFDDGYRDNRENALPVLLRCAVPAHIFLVTGRVGTSGRMWWDEIAAALSATPVSQAVLPGLGRVSLHTAGDRARVRERLRAVFKNMPGETRPQALANLLTALQVATPPRPAGPDFLSWEEVRAMLSQGITFGAHTHTHPILARIPPETAAQEIAQSKAIVERETGRPVRFFAYPNGGPADFSSENRAALLQAGFDAAVTLVHGSHTLLGEPIDWLALRRIYIGADTNRDVFIAKISGALERFSSQVCRV